MYTYQAFTPAPAGTHNNAQGVSGFTRNDMVLMAAMFPAQFGHFAGNPAPSPAVMQLEQVNTGATYCACRQSANNSGLVVAGLIVRGMV